jgi:hypothetical protein
MTQDDYDIEAGELLRRLISTGNSDMAREALRRAFRREHLTNRQSTMNVVLALVRESAASVYVDLRNRESVEASQRMAKQVEDFPQRFPFI